MKAIATYIMKSRGQAIAFSAGFAMLSLIFPLFSLVSAATVSLVTLRLGAASGLFVIVSSVVVTYVVSLVISSTSAMAPALVTLSVLLIIVWMISQVLRNTRSLAAAVMAAGLVGMVFVVAFHLAIGDTTSWWKAHFDQFFQPSMQEISAEQQQAFNQSLDNMANVMTGFLAMAFVINALVSLFIGRAWQAILYNPGGFKEEFHNLQLGKKAAIFSLIVALLILVPHETFSAIMRDMLFLILMIYVLQGISVAHAIVAIKKMQWVWLVVVYILVFVMSQLVAVAGYIDTWMDFRRRVAQQNT